MPQLNLEDNEFNYLLAVLQERPFKEVHQLIAKVLTQVQGAQKIADLAALRARPDAQGVSVGGH